MQIGSSRTGDIDVERLLEAAFREKELAFLQQQPDFLSAVSATKTLDDFPRLCWVAQNLLDAAN